MYKLTDTFVLKNCMGSLLALPTPLIRC